MFLIITRVYEFLHCLPAPAPLYLRNLYGEKSRTHKIKSGLFLQQIELDSTIPISKQKKCLQEKAIT
jgi:hypothetical protein